MPSVDILKNWVSNNSLVRARSLDTLITMTNAKKAKAITLPSPIFEDYGFEGSFVVPDNYSTAPKIIIKAILDGQPTGTVAFAYADNALADGELLDEVYGSEKTAVNATWTGFLDKELYTEEITLTALDYAAGDQVFYKLVRDASAEQAAADAFAGRLLIVSVEFSYTAA